MDEVQTTNTPLIIIVSSIIIIGIISLATWYTTSKYEKKDSSKKVEIKEQMTQKDNITYKSSDGKYVLTKQDDQELDLSINGEDILTLVKPINTTTTGEYIEYEYNGGIHLLINTTNNEIISIDNLNNYSWNKFNINTTDNVGLVPIKINNNYFLVLSSTNSPLAVYTIEGNLLGYIISLDNYISDETGIYVYKTLEDYQTVNSNEYDQTKLVKYDFNGNEIGS